MTDYIALEATTYLWFASNNTSGSGDDGASAVFDVRLAGAAAGAAPVLSGSATLLTHANFPPGCYEIAVAATTGNGFAQGNTYAVFCTLLVDSQNPTGFVGAFKTMPVRANMEEIIGDANQATAVGNMGGAYGNDGYLNANVTFWKDAVVSTPTVAGVPEVDVTHWLGTAVATPTTAGVPEVDVTFFNGFINSAWNADVVTGLGTIGEDYVNNSFINANASHWAGSAITAGSLPVSKVAGAAGGVFIAGTNAATTVNITGSITGNITGSLSGSVGSVTGSVGSVVGNVGGDVLGNVNGSVSTVNSDVNVSGSSATAIAVAWGVRVIGNGRTADMFLQGVTNKIAFDVPAAGSYTVYQTDDATPLIVGAYTASASADPVTVVNPT